MKTFWKSQTKFVGSKVMTRQSPFYSFRFYASWALSPRVILGKSIREFRRFSHHSELRRSQVEVVILMCSVSPPHLGQAHLLRDHLLLRPQRPLPCVPGQHLQEVAEQPLEIICQVPLFRRPSVASVPETSRETDLSPELVLPKLWGLKIVSERMRSRVKRAMCSFAVF